MQNIEGKPSEDDPLVRTLAKQVQLTGYNVMGSPSKNSYCRNEIRGLIMSFGPPALFITINPADLYDPKVCMLFYE